MESSRVPWSIVETVEVRSSRGPDCIGGFAALSCCRTASIVVGYC